MTPGKPVWCNGSTLARNDRDVGVNSCSRHNISITPMTLVAMTMDPVQATHCMVVEPTLSLYIYVCMVIACMYVLLCNTRLTIPGG